MHLKAILKSNNGVSMIMLVITIIMMAVIVSFAVFSSKNITPESKLAAAYSSLKTVKDACDNALNLIEINPNEYDEYYFFGQNVQNLLSESELQSILTDCGLGVSPDPNTVISSRSYLIKSSKDSETSQRMLERLELKGVTSTYLVDLENEKYYIVNGVERVDGEEVYEYKDVLRAYNMLTD